MTSLAIVTPSFAPDYELCAELHRSVREFAADTVEHHIVVPQRDLARFGGLRGPKSHLHCVTDFLPRRFVAVPSNRWVNLSHPFPPVRGWITQQLIKLAVAAAVNSDAVLLVDSDVRFIRPFAAESFVRDGVVACYRKPSDLDSQLPEQLISHTVARHLLGLPPALPSPLPDYLCWPTPWDPAIVRALVAKIEENSERSWVDTVATQAHASERTLYGVFVDEVLGAPANSFASTDMRCHRYSAGKPLDPAGMFQFLSGIKSTDLAVMISARSRTPMALRRSALHDFTAPVQ